MTAMTDLHPICRLATPATAPNTAKRPRLTRVARWRFALCYALPLALGAALPASAQEIGCVTTTWKLIGANHRICIYAYDDPRLPGVTCHISQARTGGIKGSVGLAEDPSQFSLSCRQTGPIAVPERLPESEVIFSEDTSVLFKATRVHRFYDKKRNVLVYLAISRKIIEGAPANSVSTVPIQPWGAAPASH